MSIFWIVYFISACIVAGMFALLIRIDIKKGCAVKVTLPEALLAITLMAIPFWNCVMAILMVWYYLSTHGSEHSITFGKSKE